MHPGGGETIQRRRRLPAHVYTTMDGGGARGPEYKIYHRSHARGKPDQVGRKRKTEKTKPSVGLKLGSKLW